MANEEHLAILKQGVEAWHPSPASQNWADRHMYLSTYFKLRV